MVNSSLKGEALSIVRKGYNVIEREVLSILSYEKLVIKERREALSILR